MQTIESAKAGPREPLTVTVKQVRSLLNIGNTTVWKLIREEKLASVKIAGRTLVLYGSVKALAAPSPHVGAI